jgi:Tfp pilus assembly protein PilF
LKWMFIGLFLAALMVGAGFLLTDTESGSTLSANAEAARLCELGSDQVQSFKFSEGARNLETALELDPSLAEAAIPLTMAYWRLGKGDAYKKTLALADSLTTEILDDDRRMLAQMRLGLRHNSSFSGIIDSLMTRLEKEQPDNIHVMATKAARLGMAGEEELQFQVWQSILDKNPNYAEAYNLMGYFELHRGNYQDAIEHMKKYAFLTPDLANPHDSLGEVLMVMGQYEDAAGEFRAAIALQPDFYFSYINLGKTYLYRGMTKSGLDIMNQVQEMVVGTDLGKGVDQGLMFTFLDMDMEAEISQMTRTYIERYPDHDLSPYFRAIRLAHMDRMNESQALMDSTLSSWRSNEMYHADPKSRTSVDLAQKRYEAYLADLADQPSTRIRKWSSLIAGMENHTPSQGQWYARIKLAKAYLDNNEPLMAQNQIRPILEANNRLIPALILAVRSDLALENAEQARLALEQLKWSIQQSDEDFSGRQKTALLEESVVDLEGNL